jgi:hypothetical protein
MVRALGTLVQITDEPDPKTDFDLPICDVLLDLVEQDLLGACALTFSEIAYSFADDILSLATIGARLLWYEGVTPNMTRSPDLVGVSVDAESYLVSLRTAYDILTQAFAHFAAAAGAKGTIPSQSFHDLLKWTRKPGRLDKIDERFRFVTEYFDEFLLLKEMRDRIVHNGYHTNIFTNRTSFRLTLMPGGAAHLRVLRIRQKLQDIADDLVEGKKQKRPIFQRPLLAFLKASTLSLLAFANQMALGIEQLQNRARSKTHVISGVYVPALHHLLSYKQPPVAEKDSPEQHRARVSAWLLLEARDYLGAIEWGYPDGHWWKFLTRFASFFKIPPSISSPVRHESGILLGWHLVFTERDQRFGLSLRDGVLRDANWLAGERGRLAVFAAQAKLTRALLVAQHAGQLEDDSVPEKIPDDFIIEGDPAQAADSAYQALKGRPPP